MVTSFDCTFCVLAFACSGFASVGNCSRHRRQGIRAHPYSHIEQIQPSGHLVHYLYPLYMCICACLPTLPFFRFFSTYFLLVCFWFERLHVLMSGFFPLFLPPTQAEQQLTHPIKKQQKQEAGANVDSCLRMIAVSVSVIRYWKLLNYFLSACYRVICCG